MKFQDRLYGTIELPDLTKKLAETCPVILRLREIRMANIPFFTYPSFANVDRYEHSLGVAHLAWRWALKNNLPNDLGVALSIAALYHDGSTPALGHLFEEFLSRYGFDHEKALEHVLLGRPDDLPGGENVQVFLGYQCKLRDILPMPTDLSSPLTPRGIANLVAGKGPLGRLIKGDIDFDNIDNVIRACSAMGLVDKLNKIHPYSVVDALVLDDGVVKLSGDGILALSSWASLRKLLYDSILNNSYEFRAQSALKWAIEECAQVDSELADQGAWRLTDPALMFDHLRKKPFAQMLVDRVRMSKPPDILFSGWLQDLSPLIGKGSDKKIRELCNYISDITNMEIYVNYYIDKRERKIQFDISDKLPLFGTKAAENKDNPVSTQHSKSHPSGIIGVIGLSRIDRVSILPQFTDKNKSLSKRPIDIDVIAKIIEQVLQQRLTVYSDRWVGTRHSSNEQQSLFSTL